MSKILVIDDEPDVLEFQKAFLTRRKHQVMTASNSKDAIEALYSFSPKIVFCDVRLDTDNAGLSILEQAKTIDPNIAFFLITGLVDAEIEEKAKALGVSEVLAKPISNEKLEEKIKNIASD